MEEASFYIGSPEYQGGYHLQQTEFDNCAVGAEHSILNQFLPGSICMDELTMTSAANGWYQPGFGTSTGDVGNLLNLYGIPTHSVENASIEQLATELQQGHRVIVGINSDQLWDQGPLNEFFNWLIKAFGLDNSTFNPADHAVVVTGLDLSDMGNPQVIINDPGTPDGAGATYPLDRFMDAWDNSDFHYVSTSIAPAGEFAPAFDIGKYLGFGTTLITSSFLDPITAAQAGLFVQDVVNSTDWDNLLRGV